MAAELRCENQLCELGILTVKLDSHLGLKLGLGTLPTLSSGLTAQGDLLPKKNRDINEAAGS